MVCVQLLRAYTCRSLTDSIFKIGVFTNRYMQYAVVSALAFTLLVVNLPWVNRRIFSCEFLTAQEWSLVAGCSVWSPIIDELIKLFYRLAGSPLE